MPRYQFTCLDCAESFEEKRPFARASEPAVCPACDSDHTQKQFSAIAFKVSGDSVPVPMNSHSCCGGGGCACHN